MALGQIVMTKLAVENGVRRSSRSPSDSSPASPSGSLNGAS